MTWSFDEEIKTMEREIEELKFNKTRTMGATRTLTTTLTCQTSSRMDSGYIEPLDYAVIKLEPENSANGFVFTVSQPGITADSTSAFYYRQELDADGNYLLIIGTQTSSEAWNEGETKTHTHKVIITSSSNFTSTITQRSA